MIWLGLLAVTLVALSPVLWVILVPASTKGRRETALALHRAQLAELDRELAEGRLQASEHGAARLEVQRRMLAEAASEDPAPERASRWPLIYALLLVPAGALALYMVQGQPGMPAQPLAPRQAEWAQQDLLIDQLKARLAEASDAWMRALAINFDPELAARAAEARAESLGQVDDVSAELFRRALAAAPADAEWRSLAEERLKEAGK